MLDPWLLGSLPRQSYTVTTTIDVETGLFPCALSFRVKTKKHPPQSINTHAPATIRMTPIPHRRWCTHPHHPVTATAAVLAILPSAGSLDCAPYASDTTTPPAPSLLSREPTLAAARRIRYAHAEAPAPFSPRDACRGIPVSPRWSIVTAASRGRSRTASASSSVGGADADVGRRSRSRSTLRFDVV